VRRTATMGLDYVLRRIRFLGLGKTEALWFGGPKEKGPRWSHIMVEGTRVEVKSQMKYLRLIFDFKWGFGPHFEKLAARLGAAVSGFGRIMLNLGGPCERVRRLFMRVVRSIAMYRAPVWRESLVASKRNINLLHREQRKMAIRMTRAYRTVSGEAACLLAGSAPCVYVACSLVDTYDWKKELARGDEPATPEMVEARRRIARREVIQHWRGRLPHARTGLRVVEALGPVLEDWVGKRSGGLSFHVT
jgi:hypothetical protein